jgi:hypothetical protein
MAWGTVSQTRICPWGEVESWIGGADECARGSLRGGYAMSGTSDMIETSVGGRVSSV